MDLYSEKGPSFFVSPDQYISIVSEKHGSHLQNMEAICRVGKHGSHLQSWKPVEARYLDLSELAPTS
jgi:hypothetical protein